MAKKKANSALSEEIKLTIKEGIRESLIEIFKLHKKSKKLPVEEDEDEFYNIIKNALKEVMEKA